MQLAGFLSQLVSDGMVVLPPLADPLDVNSEGLPDVLLALDAQARAEAPCVAPVFDVASATWAVEAIYRACAVFVDRDKDEDAAAALLTPAKAGPDPSPAVIWSVDLVFVQLSELWRLAKGLREDDVLRHYIVAVGSHWPLSSVGIPGCTLESDSLRSIEVNPCLRQLYIDRILRCGDLDRLRETWVRTAVAAAVGPHGELAPQIARALKNDTDD